MAQPLFDTFDPTIMQQYLDEENKKKVPVLPRPPGAVATTGGPSQTEIERRLRVQSYLQRRWGYCSGREATSFNPSGVKVMDYDMAGQPVMNPDGTRSFHYTQGTEVTGGTARTTGYLSQERVMAMPWSTERNTFDFSTLEAEMQTKQTEMPRWDTVITDFVRSVGGMPNQTVVNQLETQETLQQIQDEQLQQKVSDEQKKAAKKKAKEDAIQIGKQTSSAGGYGLGGGTMSAGEFG